MWTSTPGTGRPASETAIIVAKAIGTEKTAGWASTVSLASLPATSAATIAPVALSAPATMPIAVARAVSRVHQMPSRSIGQKVLAASAKAQLTSTEMSSSRVSSASPAGRAIAATAASRDSWSGRKGGNLAAPLLAEEVGGGAGTVGGDLFLAIIAAVAFATILAVVAGLVISASGAVAHDVWSNIVRRGRDSEHEEVHVARIAAFVIGAIAIAIAVIGGEGLNVSFMVGLAFAVAASANFPALLLALTWRRFNTTGAITGVVFGVVSSIALIIVSPNVWPGPDSEGSPIGWTLANPGIVSIPLGFLGCWLGTMLTTERGAARTFSELHVRSETGLGAERAAVS
jgi:Na+(H+)/acetate symporter ActP